MQVGGGLRTHADLVASSGDRGTRGRRQPGRHGARSTSAAWLDELGARAAHPRARRAARRRRHADASRRTAGRKRQRVTLVDAVERYLRARLDATCCARTSIATARWPGPNVDAVSPSACGACRRSRWQASGGVRDARDLPRSRPIGVAAAVSAARRCSKARITPEELRPFLPTASSPASTCATAGRQGRALPRPPRGRRHPRARAALSRRRRGRARVLRHHREPGRPHGRPQLGATASRAVLDIPFCVAGGIRSRRRRRERC